MHTFRWIFLAALTLTLLAKLYLNRRQAKHIAAHRAAVPAEFAESITLEAHQKAADYSQTKLGFGRWSEFYDTALLLLWTLGGGLALLDSIVRNFSWSPLLTGVSVILSLMLISSLLNLPFSWYSTFNIEAKYGFNKSTPTIFWTDLLKGMALSLVIGTPLIALILWIMDKAGTYWWVWAWVAWSVFSLVMLWAYPRFIAPIFNKFTPLENETLKKRINGLLEKCGFKSNGVFVMDGSTRSSHGNAYFTGIGDNKRIVFFDTLLETLEDPETEAVLAHELGHFRKKHVTKRMIMSFVFSFLGLALLGWLVGKEWFYTALGVNEPSAHMALILFMLALSVFTYFLSPIGSWFSRKDEFEADAYAAEQSDAKALISGLLKMYSDNATTLTPDPVYSSFYHSHPPALHRIQHLNNLAHKKIKEQALTGLVIANLRYHCLVEIFDNETGEPKIVRCSMRGKQKGIVCGDRVEVTLPEQGEGVIEKRLERKNELARPNMRGQKEVLTANLDQLIIVAAIKPAFDPELVDRYLATAELMPTDIILVLNKVDLTDAGTLKAWEEFRQLPYTCIETSTKLANHSGIDELKKHLHNKVSVLVGQSGVGKSSLLNVLIPGHDIQTQELSDALGEGKHTTTVASSYALDATDHSAGRLIDSPGVRDFAPPPIPADEVANGFIEIREAGEDCKFRNCQHLREPQCAVKAAVEAGTISERRYKSYRHLRDLMEKLYRPY